MKTSLKLQVSSLKLTAAVFVLLSIAFYLQAESVYPERQEKYVNDYAGVLAVTDRDTISEMIKNFEIETGDEIVVVTVNSISDYNQETGGIESFAAGLFTVWGVGLGSANTDKGILIFVSTGDRKIKIETGTGFSYKENEDMLKIVEKKMVPFFRQGGYSRGIYDGVRALVNKMGKKGAAQDFNTMLIIAGAAIMLIVLAAFLSAGKRVKKHAVIPAAKPVAKSVEKMSSKKPVNIEPDKKPVKQKQGNDLFGGGAAGEW